MEYINGLITGVYLDIRYLDILVLLLLLLLFMLLIAKNKELY